MSTIFALVAGYFILLIILSAIVKSQRERLAVLANELLRSNLQPQQERAIRKLLDTAFAMRAAPAHFLSFVAAILTPSERFHCEAMTWAKENPEIAGDGRWGEMFDCHMASIAAVNPVFGALLYVSRLIFKAKAYMFLSRHSQPRQTAKPKLQMVEVFSESRAAA